MANEKLQLIIQAQDEATRVMKAVAKELKELSKEQESTGNTLSKETKDSQKNYNLMQVAAQNMGKHSINALKSVG
jgi:L-asparaginase II